MRVVVWALVDPGQRKPWLEDVQVGLGLDELQAWVLGYAWDRWGDRVVGVTDVRTVWHG